MFFLSLSRKVVLGFLLWCQSVAQDELLWETCEQQEETCLSPPPPPPPHLRCWQERASNGPVGLWAPVTVTSSARKWLFLLTVYPLPCIFSGRCIPWQLLAFGGLLSFHRLPQEISFQTPGEAGKGLLDPQQKRFWGHQCLPSSTTPRGLVLFASWE